MRRIAAAAGVLAAGVGLLYGGNPDRVGEAGAPELTFYPWARTAGVNGVLMARVEGVEAIRTNIGGLAFVPSTEAIVSRTILFHPDVLNISALGVGQRVGEAGALGLEVFALTSGEEVVTTVSQPEGTGATFRAQFINVALSYAYSFSDAIHAGVSVRAIYEAIKDVRAAGVSLDAGIQYVTGERRQMRFGVTLRNLGFPIRYGGPGMSVQASPPGANHQLTLNLPADNFELPLLLHVGASYDLYFNADQHRISVAGMFTSNAFGDDLLGAGVEYAFREMFMLRTGYSLEKEALAVQREEKWQRLHLMSGFFAGFSVQVPLRAAEAGEEVPAVSLDYAFHPAGELGNVHTVQLRVALAQKFPVRVFKGGIGGSSGE